MVAPTIQNPACQEQLVEAAKYVAKSVDGVMDTAQEACGDEPTLQDLGAAATAVTKALNDLLQHIKHGREVWTLLLCFNFLCYLTGCLRDFKRRCPY